MNDLTVELGAWGVIINRIHTEIFGSSPSKTAGHRRGTAPVSVRFVPDSPLEGAGFEPSVPLAKEARAQAWNSSIEVTHRLLRA
jgi:hypothetical protein